jgi:hypothetical protein
LRISCCLALFVLAASAQEARRRPIASSDPPKPKKKIYTDGHVKAEKDGPTLYCHDEGIKCVIEARLLAPTRPTPVHDATLMETTAAINRILDSLAPPPGMSLCLFRSVRGPILLWSRAGGGPEADSAVRPLQAAQRAAGRITDPEAIAEILGIQEPAGRYAGGNLLAKVVWDETLKMMIFTCPQKGTDCNVKLKFATSSNARVHDRSLSQATEQINQLLDSAAARAPQPGQRLCLLFLPDGPVLAWTYEQDRPGRAVSSGEPGFREAARRALGLEP